MSKILQFNEEALKSLLKGVHTLLKLSKSLWDQKDAMSSSTKASAPPFPQKTASLSLKKSL